MVSIAINDIPQLSQYVSRVHDGERVVITKGDTVIAELSAPEPESDVPKDEEGSSFWKTIQRLSKEGEWVLAESRESSAPRPGFANVDGIDYMAVLDEVRADRFDDIIL